ncbi:MAG TPA: hypothetical protein VGT08_10455 [Terracidiphilus sp.]|nr:hypothetical protein [Terracidiphilus sp.]
MLFHLYEGTKEQAALEASLSQYKKARTAWTALAEAGKGVYMSDMTLGEWPQLRGHWLDRLPAIDKDIAALTAMLDSAGSKGTSPKVEAAMRIALGRPYRAAIAVKHAAPARFARGNALSLTLSAHADITSAILHYRHVDQVDNYATVAMERQGEGFGASIPAEYTQTEFPLEYYFEVQMADGKTALHPGFTQELTNQPYFVVRSA